VIPKFWTGTSAVPLEKFQVDCSKFDMNNIVKPNDVGETEVDHDFSQTKELVEEMTEKFDNIGAVQLINTGLETTDSMEKVSKVESGKGMWYEGGANLRGYVEKNVYDTGAPLTGNLHYHHEMAYVKESTKWLAFLCMHGCEDPVKGATYISENKMATEKILSTPFGQKLKEKGLCYIIINHIFSYE
jgi:hypothetical protein